MTSAFQSQPHQIRHLACHALVEHRGPQTKLQQPAHFLLTGVILLKFCFVGKNPALLPVAAEPATTSRVQSGHRNLSYSNCLTHSLRVRQVGTAILVPAEMVDRCPSRARSSSNNRGRLTTTGRGIDEPAEHLLLLAPAVSDPIRAGGHNGVVSPRSAGNTSAEGLAESHAHRKITKSMFDLGTALRAHRYLSQHCIHPSPRHAPQHAPNTPETRP